jgi:hypothetical protein
VIVLEEEAARGEAVGYELDSGAQPRVHRRIGEKGHQVVLAWVLSTAAKVVLGVGCPLVRDEPWTAGRVDADDPF